MNRKTYLSMLIAVVVAATLLTALTLLPVKNFLAAVLAYVESIGLWGPVLLAAVYAVACVLFIPGSILTLGAGLLFGVVRGTITVSIASVVGATAAFLVGRTLLRGRIEEWVAANRRFRAIDRAVGEHGLKIVLLLRLSPVIPFNLLNYALGLTRVRLSHYVPASWVGMLPGTLMYLGSALKSLAEVASGAPKGGTLQSVFFSVGLVMTVVATVVVTRIAKRALAEAVGEHSPPEENITQFPAQAGESPAGVR
ncbi:MAG: TVP38/TMEM64 family protein [Thermogutta sp.]|uniref:TVP38/TMEM64 family protein n=1 Tax=Thermogutta sp. TaxID=1962930 RepID=UPI001984DCAF|nr:TVP38/TMEM64 family protein [Thermogutta sp.]MBC7350761.1 TVP38/TMEM64 family protein [Thermogutta sp.]